LNVDVGQIIAGKYELVRLIGKGAMGEVWLATHNSLGGEFAIKLVEPTDDIEAETAAGRFQLEAQIAAKLSRKTRHIVSVSDHGEESGLAYLVMELLEGESLEHKTKRVGQLELPEVAAIVSQVSRALSLAHEESIFHRDLKPANVWLGRDEDGRLLVKLLDFGIARTTKPMRTRSPFATSKDMVLGTPSYMSPEQARGLDSLDYRCDLWALAVVAYEALTKRIPFEGETVEDIFLSICTFRVVPILTRRPELSPEVEAFFARAFAPNVDDRFKTAAEMNEAFEQLVTPEELETALGIPLTPASVRRLEKARAASNPNLTPAPPSSAQGMIASQVVSTPTPAGPVFAPSPRISSPDFDNGHPSMSMGVAGLPPRKSSGIGWAIGIAGVILLLGVGVLGVITFRGAKTTAARPIETSATPANLTNAPTPTTTASSSAAPARQETAVEPSASATTKPATATNGPPKPPARPTTAPNVAPVTPPTPATTHAAVPTPPTVKSVNKGEVF